MSLTGDGSTRTQDDAWRQGVGTDGRMPYIKHFGTVEIFYHTPDRGMQSALFADSSMLDESLLDMERWAVPDHPLQRHFRALWWAWEAESIVEAYSDWSIRAYGQFRHRADLWWAPAWEGTNA